MILNVEGFLKLGTSSDTLFQWFPNFLETLTFFCTYKIKSNSPDTSGHLGHLRQRGHLPIYNPMQKFTHSTK